MLQGMAAPELMNDIICNCEDFVMANVHLMNIGSYVLQLTSVIERQTCTRGYVHAVLTFMQSSNCFK